MIADVLLIIFVVAFALAVGYVFAIAYNDERGRFAYSAHRRALRTLARTNPRRSNHDR